MTSPSKEIYIYRKPSVTRSCSSDLGTVQEEREDDMERRSVFEGSLGEEEQTSEELRTGSDTGHILERSPQPSPRLRAVMKTKIKYHYMNPFQKFRARRRKPWKLVVQIVKVFLITIQVWVNNSRKLEKLNSFLSIKNSDVWGKQTAEFLINNRLWRIQNLNFVNPAQVASGLSPLYGQLRSNLMYKVDWSTLFDNWGNCFLISTLSPPPPPPSLLHWFWEVSSTKCLILKYLQPNKPISACRKDFFVN